MNAELFTGELTVGRQARSFALRLPGGASGGIPLLLVLHGNHPDASGQMMRDWTTFDEQADVFGFAVAYPDGIGGCWADGRGVTTADEAGVDDVAFLRALIDTSAGRHGTHPDRAVVAGVSNGAFMAHRMALEASEKVAVFAAVAGGLPASLREVRPAYAVSAMLIHGTADRVSPIEGGYSRHRGPNGEMRGRDAVAGRDGWVLAHRGPVSARPRGQAHHRVLQPEHGRRRRRRHAGRHLDGVRGRPHLARRQAVPRSRRDGTPGVRRRRGDLPLRWAPARIRGRPAAVTRPAVPRHRCRRVSHATPTARCALREVSRREDCGHRQGRRVRTRMLFPAVPGACSPVARVPEHDRRMTVPYHADVIGSLLRPRYLSEARAALAAGRMSNEEFKRIEDRAVDQAIAMQEGCGLNVVNDGELRRFSFLDHLLGDMEGVTDMPGAPVHFHAPDPAQDWNWHPPFTVTGRIRPKGPMMTIEEFSYARGRARVPVKITMPSPLVMYGAWSPEHSRPAYSDPFELFVDAAEIIRAEAAELAKLGCTYIQIDSPDLGTLVDPENRALREGLGMDTERTLTEGVDIINSVADVPGVTFGLHICKGNYESKWIATGGYEFTADKMFSRSGNFDVFLLEYDDERSGSFEPLANVPDDKVVVLGLVSSKLPGIEPADRLIARINEAARYVGRERLALSTQCGFSPVSIGGNLISEDTQQRKLELVAEVAHQVW